MSPANADQATHSPLTMESRYPQRLAFQQLPYARSADHLIQGKSPSRRLRGLFVDEGSITSRRSLLEMIPVELLLMILEQTSTIDIANMMEVSTSLLITIVPQLAYLGRQIAKFHLERVRTITSKLDLTDLDISTAVQRYATYRDVDYHLGLFSIRQSRWRHGFCRLYVPLLTGQTASYEEIWLLDDILTCLHIIYCLNQGHTDLQAYGHQWLEQCASACGLQGPAHCLNSWRDRAFDLLMDLRYGWEEDVEEIVRHAAEVDIFDVTYDSSIQRISRWELFDQIRTLDRRECLREYIHDLPTIPFDFSYRLRGDDVKLCQGIARHDVNINEQSLLCAAILEDLEICYLAD